MTTYDVPLNWIETKEIEYTKWIRVLNRPNAHPEYGFAIFIWKEPFNKKWILKIYDAQVRAIYHSMFINDTGEFDSSDDCKNRIEFLFVKINKLKAFI
jgi:hypothetical protein